MSSPNIPRGIPHHLFHHTARGARRRVTPPQPSFWADWISSKVLDRVVEKLVEKQLRERMAELELLERSYYRRKPDFPLSSVPSYPYHDCLVANEARSYSPPATSFMFPAHPPLPSAALMRAGGPYKHLIVDDNLFYLERLKPSAKEAKGKEPLMWRDPRLWKELPSTKPAVLRMLVSDIKSKRHRWHWMGLQTEVLDIAGTLAEAGLKAHPATALAQFPKLKYVRTAGTTKYGHHGDITSVVFSLGRKFEDIVQLHGAKRLVISLHEPYWAFPNLLFPRESRPAEIVVIISSPRDSNVRVDLDDYDVEWIENATRWWKADSGNILQPVNLTHFGTQVRRFLRLGTKLTLVGVDRFPGQSTRPTGRRWSPMQAQASIRSELRCWDDSKVKFLSRQKYKEVRGEANFDLETAPSHLLVERHMSWWSARRHDSKRPSGSSAGAPGSPRIKNAI